MRIKVALFILSILLAPSVYAMGGNSPFRGVRTYDTTPITIEMGQYYYAIPAHYFDMQPKFDCNSRSELLTALVPNIEGRSKENREAFRVNGWWRKRATILLRVTANLQTGWTAQQSMKVIHENHLIEKVEENKIAGKATKPFLGLEYHRNIEMRGKDVMTRLSAQGVPQTVIECSALGSVPSPGCSHYFADADLLVKTSYSREFLPHWEEIERNIHKLLSSMRKHKVESPKPKCDHTFGGR